MSYLQKQSWEREPAPIVLEDNLCREMLNSYLQVKGDLPLPDSEAEEVLSYFEGNLIYSCAGGQYISGTPPGFFWLISKGSDLYIPHLNLFRQSVD
jgi:hypothetical protein